MQKPKNIQKIAMNRLAIPTNCSNKKNTTSTIRVWRKIKKEKGFIFKKKIKFVFLYIVLLDHDQEKTENMVIMKKKEKANKISEKVQRSNLQKFQILFIIHI